MVLALPEIADPKCSGCGSCIETCHVTALALVESRVVLCNPERCDYCTECELVCPEDAIKCPFELTFED